MNYDTWMRESTGSQQVEKGEADTGATGGKMDEVSCLYPLSFFRISEGVRQSALKQH
jgi:hypothetical protein